MHSLKLKWTIWNELRRFVAIPFIRLYFLVRGVSWANGWRILGKPIIQKFKGSRIELGNGMIMRSWPTSNPVSPYHPVFLSTRTKDAEIIIGDEFGITGGSIIAADRVEIGSRVLVGGNCLIIDTDFHSLNYLERVQKTGKITSKPVAIGDDVFIGTQTIILKGTTIGAGSIIGAGSVVSGQIPANVVAAGNPAVVIRPLDQ